MRRRRRTRGTWFPNLGTAISANSSAAGRAFNISLPNGSAEPVSALTPLTYDVEFGEDADPEIEFSLADIVGSEYVLQRIVGKFFAHRIPVLDQGVDVAPAALVTAGFFVARANDSSVGGGLDTPVGSATAAEVRDNYSPLDPDNIREPWIWRREWVLGQAGRGPLNGVAGSSTFAAAAYPASTSLYGSVADGPHIDSKVKRRIGQDNRLFFIVTAVPFPFQVATFGQDIQGYLDYRIFGSLRKARGKSAF